MKIKGRILKEVEFPLNNDGSIDWKNKKVKTKEKIKMTIIENFNDKFLLLKEDVGDELFN